MASSTHIDIAPGAILKSFRDEEARELEAAWVSAFCDGKRTARIEAYKWHTFSYGHYPSVSGDEAQACYEAQRADQYVVLSNDEPWAIATDQRPTLCCLRDYYVFPENLAWTMAFTHEDGWLGPYFAKHQEYDALNAKNLQRLQKNEEIERARQKGWI